MTCHAAFELDLYRQTAVVFSHSLGRKRPFGKPRLQTDVA